MVWQNAAFKFFANKNVAVGIDYKRTTKISQPLLVVFFAPLYKFEKTKFFYGYNFKGGCHVFLIIEL